MTIVKLEDFKEHKFCNAGLRKGCERYGLDWWEFLQNGLPAEQLREIDDDLIKMAIKSAEEREAREKGVDL